MFIKWERKPQTSCSFVASHIAIVDQERLVSQGDNWIAHVKRRHGRVLPPARTAVNDSVLADTQLQTETQEVGSAVVILESRKRTASISPETFDTANIRAGKRLRTEVGESSCEVERTPREEVLLREIEQLRRELEKAQKEKDVLIGVIGQLTQGQK